MKPGNILLLSTAILITGCVSATAAENLPANHPKIDLPTQTTTHEKTDSINGKILESMNSGGYSYVYIQKKSGEKLWVAIPETKITVGSQMSFKEGLLMTNFQSKTLKRSFEKIIFSNGIITKTGQDKIASPPKDLSTPPVNIKDPKKKQVIIGSQPAMTGKEKLNVDKAKGANGYTIAEVYSKSARLGSKTVAVRGKVVKASSGIMKMTWLHIQDGSGSKSKDNYNLVCTTKASANVGDIVTVTGTLARNKDFGYGYKYKVILENSVISK